MDLEEKYIQIKKATDKLKKQSAEAQGAINQIRKEIKKTFGCVDLKEAKEKLKTLEQTEAELEKEIQEQMESLYGKYSEIFEEED